MYSKSGLANLQRRGISKFVFKCIWICFIYALMQYTRNEVKTEKNELLLLSSDVIYIHVYFISSNNEDHNIFTKSMIYLQVENIRGTHIANFVVVVCVYVAVVVVVVVVSSLLFTYYNYRGAVAHSPADQEVRGSNPTLA